MKYLKTIIGSIVVLIAFYYFISVLIEQKHVFSDLQSYLSFASTLPIFLFTLAVIASGYFWGKCTSILLNKRIAASEAIKVHSLSWILKYLPGQAGSLLNKLNWAVNKNHDKIAVSSSFIYENIFFVTSSIILSLPLILIVEEKLYIKLFFISLLIIGLTWYFYQNSRKSFFLKKFNFISKKLLNKELNEKYFLKKQDIIRLNFYYLLPRLLNGFGFALILIFITPLTPVYFVMSISIYILAGLIGLAAIFVPSGIGVREAVIVFFGSMFLELDIAVLVSVLSRAYTFISDIIIFLVYVILQSFHASALEYPIKS